MPILTLKSEDETIKQVRLEKGTYLKIGRSPDNDMVINESAVSGSHAEIEPEDDYFYITDRQSRNGTFLNKELIISRRLKHDDMISVGSHELEFTYEEGEERPPEADDAGDFKTLVMDTRQHRDKLAKGVSKMAAGHIEKKTVGVLTFMDSDRKMTLTKASTTIGKSPDSDIQVKGLMVGKTAAIIRKNDNEYRLAAAEGMSKPKVNYTTIKTEVVLKEFDIIEVGSLELHFNYKPVEASDGKS